VNKKKATCLTFRSWLHRFENDNHAIGDLARDVARDPDWPSGGLRRTRRHMEELGACEDALTTHDRAWEEYRRYRMIAPPCLRSTLARRVGPEDPRRLAIDAAYESGETAFADELLHQTVEEIERDRCYGIRQRARARDVVMQCPPGLAIGPRRR